VNRRSYHVGLGPRGAVFCGIDISGTFGACLARATVRWQEEPGVCSQPLSTGLLPRLSTIENRHAMQGQVEAVRTVLATPHSEFECGDYTAADCGRPLQVPIEME